MLQLTWCCSVTDWPSPTSLILCPCDCTALPAPHGHAGRRNPTPAGHVTATALSAPPGPAPLSRRTLPAEGRQRNAHAQGNPEAPELWSRGGRRCPRRCVRGAPAARPARSGRGASGRCAGPGKGALRGRGPAGGTCEDVSRRYGRGIPVFVKVSG